jgi:N utilization substance protein A
VEIKSIAREAGSRSKIAVYSKNENVDSLGACVGAKGMRVQAIVDELRGEKIDIVKWSEEPAEFISNALSPAKVIAVDISTEDKFARVIVPNYQLSLAIGKEGQNARLAVKLTGWKIDIKSASEMNLTDEGEPLYEDEDVLIEDDGFEGTEEISSDYDEAIDAADELFDVDETGDKESEEE